MSDMFLMVFRYDFHIIHSPFNKLYMKIRV